MFHAMAGADRNSAAKLDHGAVCPMRDAFVARQVFKRGKERKRDFEARLSTY